MPVNHESSPFPLQHGCRNPAGRRGRIIPLNNSPYSLVELHLQRLSNWCINLHNYLQMWSRYQLTKIKWEDGRKSPERGYDDGKLCFFFLFPFSLIKNFDSHPSFIHHPSGLWWIRQGNHHPHGHHFHTATSTFNLLYVNANKHSHKHFFLSQSVFCRLSSLSNLPILCIC